MATWPEGTSTQILKDYVTLYWQDKFAQRASGLPWERVAAWMDAESNGGFPQALGTRYEVGIIQINLADGPKYGGTTDNLHTNFCASATTEVRVRDLTDDEENLQVDVANAYISALLSTSQGQVAGLDWSDDDLWCLVKLHHALPGLASDAFNYAVANGQASDWDTMRAYCEGLPAETFPWGPSYVPWGHLYDNAEKVGKLGLSGLAGSANLGLMFVMAVIGFIIWRIS